MVDVSLSGFAPADERTRVLRRVAPSGGAFWMLFALEGLLIAGLLAAVIYALPVVMPLSATADRLVVREAIVERLSGAVEDQMIDISPGQTARSSNLRGLQLNGLTYYYYLESEVGYDPLSRGAVGRDQIDVVLRDTSGPQTLVIYTLRTK